MQKVLLEDYGLDCDVECRIPLDRLQWDFTVECDELLKRASFSLPDMTAMSDQDIILTMSKYAGYVERRLRQ